MKMIAGKGGSWRDGYANAHDMYRLLGTSKLPAEGMPIRLIDGVRVYVKPLPEGKPRERQSLRVTAICDDCGQHIAVGRMHQHRCTLLGSKACAKREAKKASRGELSPLYVNLEDGYYVVCSSPDETTVATYEDGRRTS